MYVTSLASVQSFWQGCMILLLATCNSNVTTPAVTTVAPDSLVTSTLVGAPSGARAGQLVFSSDRGGVSDTALYMMNPDGSGLAVCQLGKTGIFAGPWSPNGQKILYTGFGLIHSHVGVINADGTTIAFRSNHDGSADL